MRLIDFPLAAAVFYLGLSISIAPAQQSPDPQGHTAFKSQQGGKEEPGSHSSGATSTEALVDGKLAVPGAPADAHRVLANVALARQDFATARREAALAQQADPTLPLPAYVDGLILHGEGRYADALARFREAVAQLESRTLQLPELHFHTGDALARLGRNDEAEREFRRELHLFPQNYRARASLAMLYRAAGRDADARGAIEDLLATTPTPAAYELAARLWTIFGYPRHAAALEAAARRRFGPSWRASAGAGRSAP
jgi:tetratricopeptide (TPR) repeat protein